MTGWFSTGERLSPSLMPFSRHPDQCREVEPCSLPDRHLSGHGVFLNSFEGFSNQGTSEQTKLSAYRISVLWASIGFCLEESSGQNVVPVSSCSRFSSQDALSTVTAQSKLGFPSGDRIHLLGQLLPQGSSVVVRRRSSDPWGASGVLSSGLSAVHRRFQPWLGASLGEA